MNIKAKLLEYFQKNADVPVYRHTIAAETGLTEDQVKSNVYGMWYRDVAGARDHLEVLVNGHTWRWNSTKTKANPDAKPAKRMFEELAITKAGELLIQDDAGTVYLAKEL